MICVASATRGGFRPLRRAVTAAELRSCRRTQGVFSFRENPFLMSPKGSGISKEILSFPEKKVSLWTPERKGFCANLPLPAIVNCLSWAIDDTFFVYHRCRCCGGNPKVCLHSTPINTAAATVVGDADQGVDNNPLQVVNDCSHHQVCTDAFSLGFHKGLFLFAKRNSPL